MYYHGEGVEIDTQISLYWYLKAADQGDVRALYQLGNIFEAGEGEEEDFEEALKWYYKCFDNGGLEVTVDIDNLYLLIHERTCALFEN